MDWQTWFNAIQRQPLLLHTWVVILKIWVGSVIGWTAAQIYMLILPLELMNWGGSLIRLVSFSSSMLTASYSVQILGRISIITRFITAFLKRMTNISITALR